MRAVGHRGGPCRRQRRRAARPRPRRRSASGRELLTGDEEARLTFAGVARRRLPDDGARRLVVDIGGGSTEMVVGDDEPRTAIVSIEVGSASLTEAQLPSDPPRPEELSNAIAIVQEHVDDALRSLPDLADEVIAVVGVGGTVTTVAAVELGPRGAAIPTARST